MSQKNKKSKSEQAPISTYQTRLVQLPENTSAALDDCADLLSQVERKLFAHSQKVESLSGKVLNQMCDLFSYPGLGF